LSPTGAGIKQGSYDIIQTIEPHCFDAVACGALK